MHTPVRKAAAAARLQHRARLTPDVFRARTRGSVMLHACKVVGPIRRWTALWPGAAAGRLSTSLTAVRFRCHFAMKPLQDPEQHYSRRQCRTAMAWLRMSWQRMASLRQALQHRTPRLLTSTLNGDGGLDCHGQGLVRVQEPVTRSQACEGSAGAGRALDRGATRRGCVQSLFIASAKSASESQSLRAESNESRAMETEIRQICHPEEIGTHCAGEGGR
jgi:hypothetical protein